MERMVKMMKKDQGERGMGKKSITPTQSKTTHGNRLWQRAMRQRLEMCNPCTQYKPHNDANSHRAIDAH